jgi:hypothetical protein
MTYNAMILGLPIVEAMLDLIGIVLTCVLVDTS